MTDYGWCTLITELKKKYAILSNLKLLTSKKLTQKKSLMYAGKNSKNAFTKSEWPPSTADYFRLLWDKLKPKVYENKLNKSFKDEEELKRRIKQV